MTDREIVIMAQNDAREKRRVVLPENFGALETMLYQQIYHLCRDFDEGHIPKEEARRLKMQYVSEYGNIKLNQAGYNGHMERMAAISKTLLEAEKCGCEYCRRIARIFDGRDNVEA